MPTSRAVANATAVAIVACTALATAASALGADATTTLVTPASSSSVWGQPVVLTASVTDTTAPATKPTGSVQFMEGATALGSPVVVDGAGQAALVTPALEVGVHGIAAAYTPADVNAFMASTSPAASVTVAKAATTTTLVVSPRPTVAGQDTTFTASVAAAPPGAGTPTGSVAFFNRNGPLFDFVALNAMGLATTTASAPAGMYTVDATYQGDPHFDLSTGSVDTQVNRAATSTSVTITPAVVAPNGTSNVHVAVGVVPPGDTTPQGALQFTIDGAPQPSGSLTAGSTYDGALTAGTVPGPHVLTVTYGGDDDAEPSSASAQYIVSAPPAPASAASTAPVSVARLKTMVGALTTALRLRGLAALATTTERLVAGPGVLDQKVYSPAAPGARAAARKPVMIASGRHRFATAGAGTLRLQLSSAGRRAIRHARSLKLAIVTRYTPAGGKALVTTKRITVRAKPKGKGRDAGALRGFRLSQSAPAVP